jgi:hypothetical protein
VVVNPFIIQNLGNEKFFANCSFLGRELKKMGVHGINEPVCNGWAACNT